MNKKFAVVIALISLILVGWGAVGHKIINSKYILSMPAQMGFLSSWKDSLSLHSSDADNRKGGDPNEAPKHFIDIDDYAEYIANGTITQSLDSLILLHGNTTVYDNGILPWAIIAAEDTLKACFQRLDWHKAMLTAADLGHYVGDGHMPLHITKNYNGQLSGQTGIHSRYESNLISNYQTQIVYVGDSALYITNVSNFVFNFIYESNHYVDTVLAADSWAKAQAGNTNSTLYYQKFWEKMGNATILLFKNASFRLASLIYTAWVNAGRPNLTGIKELDNNYSFQLSQNYPNPFNPTTKISWSIDKPGNVKILIYDQNGQLIKELVNRYYQRGAYSAEFKADNLSSGVYFAKMIFENKAAVKKMLLIK